MDNEEYRANNIHKLRCYHKNGYYEGINFFVTMESDGRMIDYEEAEMIIKRYCLWWASGFTTESAFASGMWLVKRREKLCLTWLAKEYAEKSVRQSPILLHWPIRKYGF